MDALVLNALKTGTKKKPKVKPLKEFHAKEQHDGKYIVRRSSGKPNDPDQEHTADDMAAVHQALEDHMGGQMAPPDGDADSEAPMGAGQPGMGGVTA
jgi:hypothetical protein